MAFVDTTEIDFSESHGAQAGQTISQTATVSNSHTDAALHVVVQLDASWLDVYPQEFALAPQESQAVVVEMRPAGARHEALAPTNIVLHGQYLEASPREITAQIRVVPQIAACPNCRAELPESARECRRCGERIRLCPVCGSPNTWIARVCRRNAAHVLRTETDWMMTPGGAASHQIILEDPNGLQMARLWSYPAYPVTRAEEAIDWSAPLAAFGMVIAAGIEAYLNRATVQCFELSRGEALWDFDLPDPSGVYPDRGGMALSADGHLYAATLAGSVVAVDSIRGTRLWETQVGGPVYGAVTLADAYLLVPSGEAICVLDRVTGAQIASCPVGARLDSASAYGDGRAYAACDDQWIYAYEVPSGTLLWKTWTDGTYDASPVLANGVVFTATMAGTVYALDMADGKVLWQTSACARPVAVTPGLTADGLLLVAADDGYVHIIDSKTSNLTRSRRISSAPLRTSPVCSGHTVFCGADDGWLSSLDSAFAIHRAYELPIGARFRTASPALYGDTLACAATNGVLYVLRAQ